MARNKELLELELQEQKSETQKQMAWVAMLSMIVGTIFLYTPIIKETRVWAKPSDNVPIVINLEIKT